MESSPIREFSSLRDPSGFVFYFDGGVYRALDNDAHAVFQELNQLGLFDRLMDSGKIVKSQFIASSDIKAPVFRQAFPEHSFFIQHDAIPTLTMPAEWTWSMLCDAAMLELSLQSELVEAGFMLKDATAYNVQFINHQPIHIDLSSIEKRAGGLWPAYGQFCRMFLFPLMLARHAHVSTKAYFLTYINGMELDEVVHTIGVGGALRPKNFMDIFLPYFFQSLFKKKSSDSMRKTVDAYTPPKESLRANLNRLTRLVQSLRNAGRSSHSKWDRYHEENLYSHEERRAKKEAVKRLLSQIEVNTLIDLGCNTGEYTFLAAEQAKRVIAVESDHESLDRLYNQAKEKEAAVLPIWTDLLNPTPAMGFRNKERIQFHSRVRGDVVMALALVHHLIAGPNFSLQVIADMLFELTDRYLLVEYISPNDPQFESLVGLRENTYTGLTEAAFVKVFSERGRQLQSVRLNKFRVLYLFAKS